MTETHAHSALLVMDVQVGIVTRYVQGDDWFASLHTALDAARATSIPVIYVAVGFRPGYPEISPRNKSFGAIKRGQSPLSAAATSMEIHPALAPQPADIVVTKRRLTLRTP
jgi:nicotinamidase-related amidase